MPSSGSSKKQAAANKDNEDGQASAGKAPSSTAASPLSSQQVRALETPRGLLLGCPHVCYLESLEGFT